MDVVFMLLLGGIGITIIVAMMVLVSREPQHHEEHFIPPSKTDNKTSQNE